MTAVATPGKALHKRAQPWLGTLVEAGFYLPEASRHSNCDAFMTTAFKAAFAACRRVHLAMSPALLASDISRFNRAPAGSMITCDPWTIRVLMLATRLQEASAGLFDITQGSGSFRCTGTQYVIKEAGGTRLNTGGIAKGFAVDRMVTTLRAHGIKSGYVNAGGDLRVFGELDWPILRRQSNHQPVAAPFSLHQGSVASSVFADGLSPFHGDALINPAMRNICRKNIGVSVAAPRCVFADALTKVVALTGNLHHPALQAFHASAWVH